MKIRLSKLLIGLLPTMAAFCLLGLFGFVLVQPSASQTLQLPLRLNEVQPNPLPSSADYSAQFIEIYNTNAFTVDIGGFSIRDSGDDGLTPTVYFFPRDTEIGPNSALAVYNSTSGIVLDSNDSVLLLNANLEREDGFSYSAVDSNLGTNELFVRLPDATGTWYVCENATPNALNDVTCDDVPDSEVELRGTLNEINPFPAPPAGDYSGQYVEIWNANSTPIDISGFQISDSGANRVPQTVFTIPSGTILQPDTGVSFGHAQTGIVIDPDDTIQLINPTDSGIDDSFQLDVAGDGLQSGDLYSRSYNQDGIGTWTVCDDGTPNQPNAFDCGPTLLAITLSQTTSSTFNVVSLLILFGLILLSVVSWRLSVQRRN